MSVERLELLYQLERYDQLLEEAIQLRGEDPDGVAAPLYSIVALMAKGELAEAQAYCSRVRMTCAASSHYWYLTAKVLRHQKLFRKADEAIDQALKLDCWDADYLCEKALIAWGREKVAETKHYFDQALAQEPAHRVSLLGLAAFYGGALERPDLARTILQRYLAREPLCPNAMALLAEFEPYPWRKATIYQRLLALSPFDKEAQQAYRHHGPGRRRLLQTAIILMLLTLLVRLLVGSQETVAMQSLQEPLLGGLALLGVLLALALFPHGWPYPLLFWLAFAPLLWFSHTEGSGITDLLAQSLIGLVFAWLAFLLYLLRGWSRNGWLALKAIFHRKSNHHD